MDLEEAKEFWAEHERLMLDEERLANQKRCLEYDLLHACPEWVDLAEQHRQAEASLEIFECNVPMDEVRKLVDPEGLLDLPF